MKKIFLGICATMLVTAAVAFTSNASQKNDTCCTSSCDCACCPCTPDCQAGCQDCVCINCCND